MFTRPYLIVFVTQENNIFMTINNYTHTILIYQNWEKTPPNSKQLN